MVMRKQERNGPDWFDRIPKVELHVHLEGAIPLDTLRTLIAKYLPATKVPTLTTLRKRFRFRSFTEFVDAWVWKNRFLRETEDFTFIAEAVARDLAGQNTRYAEVFLSPTSFVRPGLSVQDLIAAVRRGLDRISGIEIGLVVDFVRDNGPDQASSALDRVCEVRDCGVIGVGIGGSEHRFPPEPFREVFFRARRMGFRTSAHAGEAAGPPSVWGAVRVLGVERIGHGTRVVEDSTLVDHLAATGTSLEMCPLSNVRTGVVSSIEAHPLRRLRDRGVSVTVSTDDPMMFANSLAEEFRALAEWQAFTGEEIRNLILEGVRSSWLPEERKQALFEAIEEDPVWIM